MVQNWRASSKPRGNVVKNNKVIPWNIGTKRVNRCTLYPTIPWANLGRTIPKNQSIKWPGIWNCSSWNNRNLFRFNFKILDTFFFMDKFPRRVAVFYEIKILSNISIANYSFMQHSPIINIFHIIFSFKILTRL